MGSTSQSGGHCFPGATDLRSGNSVEGGAVEIIFDPEDEHLIFHSADGEPEKRLPPKGISVTDLMGEMGPLVNLAHFQLALPFAWDEWRVIRLSETLGV